MAKLAKLIFFIYLILVIIGLLFITNSSVVDAYREFGNQWVYLIKQLVWVFISFIVYIIISHQTLKRIYSISPNIYWLNIILLILVLIPGIGQKIQGARRWLNIGFSSLQPSEFIKTILAVYLPYLIHNKKVLPKQFLFAGFLPVGLILLQPDLGTSLVISLLIVSIYYLSSFPIKDLMKYIPFALILLIIYIFTSPYRLQRIKTYFSHSSDNLNSSYQSRQSLIAIGRGGLFGTGFGQSRQKYNFLPESSTDSIFSIVAEETGLIGSTFIFLVYSILIIACFHIASNSTQKFSAHTAASIGVLISIQTLLNLGAISGLLPLTGVPLPFISYGGSSLLNFSMGLAIITVIAKNE